MVLKMIRKKLSALIKMKLCFDMKQVALRNCRSDEERALVKDVTPKQLLSWGILTEYEGKLVPTNAYAILTYRKQASE